MGRGQILLLVPSHMRHPTVTISSAWGSALCGVEVRERDQNTAVLHQSDLFSSWAAVHCSCYSEFPFFSLWKCLRLWKRLYGAFPAKQEPAEAVLPALPPCKGTYKETRVCGHLLREEGFPQEWRE